MKNILLPMLILGSLTAATRAQSTPPASPLPQTVIVANASLVNMVFSVEDKHHALLPGLTQADFRVAENGKPQAIQFFSLENDLPLTLGLLLDTSPSQANVLGIEQQVSDQFFQQVVTKKDLAFVIGFDIDTRLLQDLTSSPRLLSAAVDQTHIGGGDASGGMINPGTFPQGGHVGATHLWDAIYLACHDELSHQVGRKAIIVVTDGGEQGSTYTSKDALRAALDSNTIVYAVIAADRSFGYGGGFIGSGPGELQKIADQTGGRTYNVGRKIGQAFTQIQDELRTQYTLAYHSTDDAHDGTFRAVKIELQGPAAKQYSGAKVRARTGYFADSPSGNNN